MTAIVPAPLQQAIALYRAKRWAEAEKAFHEILARKPDCADALHHLGLMALQVGQPSPAVDYLGRAAALAPNDPAIHSNLGEAYRRVGRSREAIASLRHALALRPEFANALCNLGAVLSADDQFDEAIACFRKALAINPALAEASNNLGFVLAKTGHADQATAFCRHALALRPEFSDAHNNLGTVYRDQGQLDASLDHFRRAIALNPGDTKAQANFLYTLWFHPNYDAPGILRAHREWAALCADPLRSPSTARPNTRDPERRLRIGYVSPDLRDHVVGRNLLPLLQHHDHRCFVIFCYADVPRPDAVTALLRAGADTWRDITGWQDEQLAAQVRADQIDILVDLTLHMTGNRLLAFARKPAPVQATFAGYPGTTGLHAMDYRLTDPFLDPLGTEADYSEMSVRLARTFWCYAPGGDEPPVAPLPALQHGHVTFGCLNNFCKVNAEGLRLWARVLRATPTSRLRLLAHEGEQRQRVRTMLQNENVAPERIEFVSPRARTRYLELYAQIDLSLDTLPYNGHTTSLDAMWMGVPVVTRIGKTVVGRAGWSQLSNLQLTELAAHTDEQFVEIACALAGDLPRLATLRSSLRARMEKSPLMNAPGFARDIETAYRAMWRRWVQDSTSAS